MNGTRDEAAPAAAERPRRQGFDLGRIAGIRIGIDYSWFLIFLLIFWGLSAGYFPQELPDRPTSHYWIAGFFTSLAFFLSILAHELAHSFVAIRAGIPVPRITLFLFGGVSHMEEDPRDPKTEIKVAAVGPLTSFALAGGFWGLHYVFAPGGSTLWLTVVQYLAWINLALGIFNLLPGFPLDGGRVFRAVVWWRTGSLQKGTKAASLAGQGFGITLAVLGGLLLFTGAFMGGIWFILIGLFLRGMAKAGYQQLLVKQALEGMTVGEVMVREPESVGPSLSVRQLIEDHVLRFGYRGFPVVDEGRPVGVVSIDEVKGVPPELRDAITVREKMLPLDERVQLDPDTPLSEALQRMSDQQLNRLLVMRDGSLQGMITRTGLSRFIELRKILRQTS